MSQNNLHICVIGAEVNNIEQRQILNGIVQEARLKNVSIIVISNLYNHLEQERSICADNKVYELISDIIVDGFIMLSESFVNPVIRKEIHDMLIKRIDKPIIMVGTSLPEFEPELFPCISTSDKNDIEFIVDELIEKNGFTQISFLSGPFSLEASQNRIDGYRSSLSKHNISYDDSVVYEGDFWYNSGEHLAEKYISGDIKYPQALICANDYMAFGVLDKFADKGIDITQHMALVGYEYIPERSLHKPLLTTFKRNREALGVAAVDMLLTRLNKVKEFKFTPPSGSFIVGQSCPYSCFNDNRLQEELSYFRTKNQFALWNLKSDMESYLTECKNYDEFISVMGDELYIIRNAKDIVLCLYENWFKENEEHSDILICRNINKYARRDDIVIKESELHSLSDYFKEMAVLYVNPIFFKTRLLGYSIVMYDIPDTYDNTYRHWLKSVSNSLEFLRLKTDINYLMQCSTLSSAYDGLTGLFNKEGMRTAIQLIKNTDKPAEITAIALRFECNNSVFTSEAVSKEIVSNLVAISRIIKLFCGNKGIAGRISETEFILVYPNLSLNAELIVGAVYAEILFSNHQTNNISIDNLIFCVKLFRENNVNFNRITEDISAFFNKVREVQKEKIKLPHYKELENIRKEITVNPIQKYSLDEISSSLNLNNNYFNRIYKEIYGTTFNQDQIRSRIRLAQYLLFNRDLSVVDIAEKCGYSDSKYFIKQFASTTGLSPKQYRVEMKKFLD